MRLRHDCDRNLADVIHDPNNAGFTADGLLVTPRPNVDQQEYRAWDRANRTSIAVADRAGDADNPYARTYVWRCRCGAAPVQRRHERISELWRQHTDDPRPVVVVTLADDGLA